MFLFDTDGLAFSRNSCLLRQWRDPRFLRQMSRSGRHGMPRPSHPAYGRVCADDNEAI